MDKLKKYTDFESLKTKTKVVSKENIPEAIQKHKAFEEAIIFFRSKKLHSSSLKKNEG